MTTNHNPNDYRRDDVVALARIIDPPAWYHIPVGEDTESPRDYTVCENSINIAVRILLTGYRDCRL
jgi:hypothetical protein